MNTKEMKEDLVLCTKIALNEYLQTTRGANAFGASVTVLQPAAFVLQIFSRTEQGPKCFEILIKEKL